MPDTKTDEAGGGVVVVGGGIIGLSVAWQLRRQGRPVTLIDRDRVGRATSWAAAGIFPPCRRDTADDPLDQLRGFSHQVWLDWVPKLQRDTGIDVGFRRCGGWYLADTPGEAASLSGMVAYWRDLGIECEPIDAPELAHREPLLDDWSRRHPDATCVFTADECQIRPPRLLRALAKACQQEGVQVMQQTRVVAIETESGRDAYRLRLSESHGGTIETNATSWRSADVVVLCGGSHTGLIDLPVDLSQSLVPIRGQMLLLKAPGPAFGSVINVGHRYVLCRDDGATLVGSCEEEAGLDASTTPEVIDDLHDFAVGLCPELGHAMRVDGWAGLRPLTFDGFPMIGEVPGQRNLFVASGHFRSGIHFAAGTATLLGQAIDGRSPELSLAPFGVGRPLAPPVP